MNNVRTGILIGLFTVSLSVTSHAEDSALLRGINLGTDVARMALTNAALNNPNNAPALHAAAATAGIASNIALIKLLENDPDHLDVFAIASSIGTHLVDLIVHLKNPSSGAVYQDATTLNLMGIRTTQLLELVTNCLAHYASTDAFKTANLRIAMYSLHTSLEALEKLLITSSYEPTAVNKKTLVTILASSLLLNAISSGYHGIIADPILTPEAKEEEEEEARRQLEKELAQLRARAAQAREIARRDDERELNRIQAERRQAEEDRIAADLERIRVAAEDARAVQAHRVEAIRAALDPFTQNDEIKDIQDSMDLSSRDKHLKMSSALQKIQRAMQIKAGEKFAAKFAEIENKLKEPRLLAAKTSYQKEQSAMRAKPSAEREKVADTAEIAEIRQLEAERRGLPAIQKNDLAGATRIGNVTLNLNGWAGVEEIPGKEDVYRVIEEVVVPYLTQVEK